MPAPLPLIEKWQRFESVENPNRHLTASRLRRLYETLASQLFQQFEPTKKISSRVSNDFLVRLNKWLECFESEEDQWAAFRSIEYVLFAGQAEFEELYRCAFDDVIKRWLIDQAGIDIFSPDVSQQLDAEIKALWPCPVTDSLRINGFLHITGLPGQTLRPDWFSLKELSSPDRIKSYCDKKHIKYLVLIEDFVGSGGQLGRVLQFAAKVFPGPILVVPLIICAPGDRQVRDEIKSIGKANLSYQPISILDDACLIREQPFDGEPALFEQLRRALNSGFAAMQTQPKGGPFGWKGIGSLMVMYSNCPNNTPPVYHHTTSSWTPPFPRSDRFEPITYE